MAGASCLKSNRWFVFVGADDGTTLRRLNGVFLILCLRRITSRRHHLCREHMVEGRLAGRAEFAEVRILRFGSANAGKCRDGRLLDVLGWISILSALRRKQKVSLIVDDD